MLLSSTKDHEKNWALNQIKFNAKSHGGAGCRTGMHFRVVSAKRDIMKQLVISPTFPHSSHTFVTREVGETLNRGHEVVILAPGVGDDEGRPLAEKYGIRTENVIYADVEKSPILSLDPLRLSKEVRKAAQRAFYGFTLAERRKSFFTRLLHNPAIKDVQLIHAHFTGWAYEIALPLSKLLGVPFTLVAHDGHLTKHPNDHLQALQESAEGIALPSTAWRDLWVSKTKSLMRLHVIPNAVNASEFLNNKRDIEHGSVVSIVTIARLVPKKRVSDGLLVLRQLLNRNISCQYTIIGSGPESKILLEQAHSLGLLEHVHFLGVQPHSRVADELTRSDIYFHPSETESFGISMAEAMAAGLPVVAARSGGALDIVVNGVTGTHCPVGDIHCMTNAIADLINNVRLRIEQGEAGQMRVLELFNWEARMKSLTRLWQDALN